jgi:hypothetical protein
LFVDYGAESGVSACVSLTPQAGVASQHTAALLACAALLESSFACRGWVPGSDCCLSRLKCQLMCNSMTPCHTRLLLLVAEHCSLSGSGWYGPDDGYRWSCTQFIAQFASPDLPHRSDRQRLPLHARLLIPNNLLRLGVKILHFGNKTTLPDAPNKFQVHALTDSICHAHHAQYLRYFT